MRGVNKSSMCFACFYLTCLLAGWIYKTQYKSIYIFFWWGGGLGGVRFLGLLFCFCYSPNSELWGRETFCLMNMIMMMMMKTATGKTTTANTFMTKTTTTQPATTKTTTFFLCVFGDLLVVVLFSAHFERLSGLPCAGQQILSNKNWLTLYYQKVIYHKLLL